MAAHNQAEYNNNNNNGKQIPKFSFHSQNLRKASRITTQAWVPNSTSRRGENGHTSIITSQYAFISFTRWGRELQELYRTNKDDNEIYIMIIYLYGCLSSAWFWDRMDKNVLLFDQVFSFHIINVFLNWTFWTNITPIALAINIQLMWWWGCERNSRNNM